MLTFIWLLFFSLGAVNVLGQAKAPDVPEEAGSSSALRTVSHDAFQAGEKLEYRVRYGYMHAGKATLEVRETDKEVQGRKMLHMVGKGWSTGTFNWFFKVDDRYETYIDKEGVFPWVFIRRVNEGGYLINQDYVFYQSKNKVETERWGTKFDEKRKARHKVPAMVQDVFSSFYYARTIDFSQAQPGDTYEIKCFLDEELYPFQIKYLGRETIRTHHGKFRCLKFCPVVQEGRIFKEEEDLTVWVTADGNNIPVLAKAKVLVGSIKMELTGHEGLANPISRVD